MKVAVRYYTKTGNTKKLAEAVAQGAGTEALTVDNPITEPVDILFIGGAVYAATLSSELKTFISGLEKEKVGKVAVFSSSALTQRVFPIIRSELEKKGIEVIAKDFYCRGRFKFLYKDRPNEADLEAAKKFASDTVAANG